MSDRDNDWLRYGLSEIAMKAAVPNLRERAVRTSRRNARRQLLGISAAVAVLLLGGAALAPRLSASKTPVGDPSPTVSADTTTSPSPSADPSASAGPSHTPSGPPPAASLTGALYYVTAPAVDGSIALHALGGYDFLLPLSFGGGSCPSNSVMVSPDGKHVTWVATKPTADSILVGDLMVASINGSQPKLLQAGVSCLGDVDDWTADSRGLYFRPAADKTGTTPKLVDIATGNVSAAPNGYAIRSPNDQFVARMTGRNTATIGRANGTNTRSFTYTPPDDAAHAGIVNYNWIINRLSADGRYVALSPAPSDPTRPLGSVCVVDTVTGKDLPATAHTQLNSVHFLNDGRILIERSDGALALMSTAGVVTATGAALRGGLLRYVP
jgi:hypothetical protein